MPYTLLTPSIYLQATVGAALASSTSATDISTNPQFVLPPNTVTTVGQTLRMRAAGVFGTNTTGTNNLTLGFYKNTQTTSGATGVGGTALAASPATTMTNSLTNAVWQLDVFGTFTAVGSSGTVFCYGTEIFETSTATDAVTVLALPTTTPQTAVSFNTTVPNLLTVGATWSVSNASNTITCNDFVIELMN